MAEEPGVIACHTLDSWTDQLDAGKNSGKLIVVDFTASWCGPCRFIAPIYAEMAKKTPHVLFLKVDVDELQLVAEEWHVEAMPTFIFIKEGKEVDRIQGAVKKDLEDKVALHGGAPPAAAAAAAATL